MFQIFFNELTYKDKNEEDYDRNNDNDPCRISILLVYASVSSFGCVA